MPGLGALRGLALLGLGGCAGNGGTGPAGTYGMLQRRSAANTGQVLLALPEGFEYTVFGLATETLSDGRPTPPMHDGMAAFQVGSELRLVRNHEVRFPVGPGAAIVPGGSSYDPHAGGGTTTLVIDPESRLPVRSWASLSGTSTNCAGGPTPWGSWISCEETTAGPGAGYTRPHGYCFEVAADADQPVTPAPLVAMGRFVHEAVAVDRSSGAVYLTEDQLEAGLFRFLPDRPGVLGAGGRLQMLAIPDRPRLDTRRGQSLFTELPVEWVDIPDPDPDRAELLPGAVRQQGLDRGAALFGRLEGAWYGAGRLYVNSTSGGDLGLGQVWEYHPDGDEGTLRLLFESPSTAILNHPDNLCMSPRDHGLVLCEDGPLGNQFLRGLTRDGQIFDFARNDVPGFETSEFAGATFSPDGQTLFVNLQLVGATLAIWGDWERGAL